jgi:hypothetical protein
MGWVWTKEKEPAPEWHPIENRSNNWEANADLLLARKVQETVDDVGDDPGDRDFETWSAKTSHWPCFDYRDSRGFSTRRSAES